MNEGTYSLPPQKMMEVRLSMALLCLDLVIQNLSLEMLNGKSRNE